MFYKFFAGGWATLLVKAIIICICLLINKHYACLKIKLSGLDVMLTQPLANDVLIPHAVDPQDSTAIIFVNSLSVGMHTLLSIMRLFPGQFKNVIFLSVGEVDTESYRGESELARMQAKVNTMLDYFVKYCHQCNIPAESYSAFGTDLMAELEKLADLAGARYPRGIYFTSRLVFAHENVVKWYLYNQTPLLLQHYLHFRGKELMILPMKI